MNNTKATEFFSNGKIAILGWKIGNNRVYIQKTDFETVSEDYPKLVTETLSGDTEVFLVIQDDAERIALNAKIEMFLNISDAGNRANEICEQFRK